MFFSREQRQNQSFLHHYSACAPEMNPVAQQPSYPLPGSTITVSHGLWGTEWHRVRMPGRETSVGASGSWHGTLCSRPRCVKSKNLFDRAPHLGSWDSVGMNPSASHLSQLKDQKTSQCLGLKVSLTWMIVNEPLKNIEMYDLKQMLVLFWTDCTSLPH